MRRIAATACMMMVACAGGDLDTYADFASMDNLAPDVPFLSDAVFLEPGGPDASPGDTARETGADTGVADVPFLDLPGTWDTLPLDAPVATDVAPADAVGGDCAPDSGPPPVDTMAPDSGGDIPRSPCDRDGKPCGPGLACVLDAESNAFCAPIDECSDTGAIDLQEMVAMLLTGQGEIHVKVKAKAWPGVQTCSIPDQCSEGHPCCKSCFAPMFIGSDPFPIVLHGMGIPIGCEGTECDVLDNCRPILPGSWYWVWGKVAILGGKAQFSVIGFCAVDDQTTDR